MQFEPRGHFCSRTYPEVTEAKLCSLDGFQKRREACAIGLERTSSSDPPSALPPSTRSSPAASSCAPANGKQNTDLYPQHHPCGRAIEASLAIIPGALSLDDQLVENNAAARGWLLAAKYIRSRTALRRVCCARRFSAFSLRMAFSCAYSDTALRSAGSRGTMRFCSRVLRLRGAWTFGLLLNGSAACGEALVGVGFMAKVRLQSECDMFLHSFHAPARSITSLFPTGHLADSQRWHWLQHLKGRKELQ